MVNESDIRRNCSSLLNGQNIIATGIFVIQVDFVKGYVIPAATGAAVGVGVHAIEALAGFGGVGAKVAAAAVGGVAVGRMRHHEYKKEAAKQGFTPVMVVTVTSDNIYLLDWDGNVRSGKGPSKVLMAFTKKGATVHSSKQGVTTAIVISENGASAAIEANLGMLAPNKKMNRNVIKELEKVNSKR